MARTRKQEDGQLTHDQLVYLAGMFEATIGLRGVGTQGAMGISTSEPWPNQMAETYGGVCRQFTSKNEKTFWGWYVSINRRLELATLLRDADVTQALNIQEWEAIVHKLERAVNSGKGDLGE